MLEASRQHPPSEKQIASIHSFGYLQRMPTTAYEASLVLDCLQSGQSHERSAKFEQLTPIERAHGIICNAERDILNGIPVAGWRLKIIDESKSVSTMYMDAFLPLDVAKQFPELLTDSNLDFSKPLKNRPWKGRIVVTPGEIGEIEPKPQTRSPVTILERRSRSPASVKAPGCMGPPLLLLIGLLWLFVSIPLLATDGSSRTRNSESSKTKEKNSLSIASDTANAKSVSHSYVFTKSSSYGVQIVAGIDAVSFLQIVQEVVERSTNTYNGLVSQLHTNFSRI